VRDTAGTALYFFEYDAMRHLLGRQRSGEQGPTPAWLPIPTSLIPFVCGSLAGVSSWALIYPLDVLVHTFPLFTKLTFFPHFIRVKTKVQQRALAGTPPKGVWETLRRLVRGTADQYSRATMAQNSLGPDPKDPKPVLAGIARIYRGLGVSAVRSITTHGLLWTFFDITSHYIDHLP
jgi:solute carrier family 25 carnitine/acylcarnitine transporter 20/29